MDSSLGTVICPNQGAFREAMDRVSQFCIQAIMIRRPSGANSVWGA